MRPLIGVTPDEGTTQPRTGRPALPRYELKRAYTRAIAEAGGLPLILPYAESDEEIAQYADTIAGLVVTGGAFDIEPAEYGDRPQPGLGVVNRTRTRFERRLLEAALARGLPVLGICGGMQLLNVIRRGTLVQDIARERPRALNHEQPRDPLEPGHAVQLEPHTLLANLVGTTTIQVNSTHHQAIGEVGRGLLAHGRAPDGIIEVLEDPAAEFVLGVQWHPELLADETSRALHAALVRAAANRTS